MSVARPCLSLLTAFWTTSSAEYTTQGQTAMVTVDDQEITVMAFPAEASALDFVMPMLKAGKIAEAVPYLQSLTKSAPANAAVLYNLGISYSELAQYDEAIIRLKRTVQLDPATPTPGSASATPTTACASPSRRSKPSRKRLRLTPTTATPAATWAAS